MILKFCVFAIALAATGCSRSHPDQVKTSAPAPAIPVSSTAPAIPASPVLIAANAPVREQGPVASMMAWDVWSEFGANVLDADRKYKGKILELSGSVDFVRADDSGRYYAAMCSGGAMVNAATYARMTDQQKKWYNEGYPPSLLFYIAADSQAPFTSLPKGKMVSIVGRCVGMKKETSVPQGYVVILENCRLAKP